MLIYFLFILIISTHISFFQTKNNNNMKLNLRKPNFPLLDIENTNMSLFDDNKLFNNQNIIELEINFVVTKISWTRKEEYKFNYFLGIFEVLMIHLFVMEFL